jgi:hypothetical protein
MAMVGSKRPFDRRFEELGHVIHGAESPTYEEIETATSEERARLLPILLERARGTNLSLRSSSRWKLKYFLDAAEVVDLMLEALELPAHDLEALADEPEPRIAEGLRRWVMAETPPR